MIEIEVFQENPKDKVYVLRIWHGSIPIYSNPVCTEEELVELRDELQNELAWLNKYIYLKGLDLSKPIE